MTASGMRSGFPDRATGSLDFPHEAINRRLRKRSGYVLWHVTILLLHLPYEFKRLRAASSDLSQVSFLQYQP